MSYVQKTSASVDNAAGIGAPQLTGVVAGNTLALILGTTTAGTIGEASWPVPTDSSGQTWLKAVGPVSVGTLTTDQSKGAIYYLLNANAGTHTLTQAWSAGMYGGYTFLEFAPCTAVDVTTSNGGTTNVTTGNTGTTATTTQANDVVLIGLTTNNSGAGLANSAFTDPPAGYTSLFAAQATNAHTGAQHSYKEVASAGAQSATWTWTTASETSWQAVIATFKLTGGGGAAVASRNGIALSGISAIDGITKSSISAVNGLTI